MFRDSGPPPAAKGREDEAEEQDEDNRTADSGQGPRGFLSADAAIVQGSEGDAPGAQADWAASSSR